MLSSMTSPRSTERRRMSSWPDSIRTLSSRLSTRRIRRSTPRSTLASSSAWGSGPSVASPSRSISIDASCAASGVRNSCEMLPSTLSRARRAASRSVSSRITCTCWPPTGAALTITAERVLPSSRHSISDARPWPPPRAPRMGAVCLAGAAPVGARARPQHVATEPPQHLRFLQAQQPHHLRVRVADHALLVHRVDAFGDAAENGTRLGLAAPQRVGQVGEVAAHLLHRARQRADLGRCDRRNRGGEVALPEAQRHVAQRDDRPREPATVEQACEARDPPPRRGRRASASAGTTGHCARTPRRRARRRAGPPPRPWAPPRPAWRHRCCRRGARQRRPARRRARASAAP